MNASNAKVIPIAAFILAAASLALWLQWKPSVKIELRAPSADSSAAAALASGGTNPVFLGSVVLGPGKAANIAGSWTRFRGARSDGIQTDSDRLSRNWGASGPRAWWRQAVGEGYAGAVVRGGRVYVMDYDQAKRRDALRCLSLADGAEIWRYSYPLTVKRNHGMSRAVPAVDDQRVVAIGPLCQVVCADADTGQLRWGLDLARDFGASVPPWYNGQCPLIDGSRVILAAGGNDALLVAVNAADGKALWKSANPKQSRMTHSSVMPMECFGQKFYVYCGTLGVAGIDAATGQTLWDFPDWRTSIATIPSPVILTDGRIFLAGGYNAGAVMLQLRKDSAWRVQTLFKLAPEIFGATQQTPIFFQDHIYGVRPNGQMVCLDLSGKILWTSGARAFGLGPFIIADGALLAMSDSGKLALIEATPAGFDLKTEARVLHGRESWGPLALAGTRLIARDFTEMVCLDLSGSQ